MTRRCCCSMASALTGAVWRRAVLELVDMWTGRIVVCDLPGHGRSAALATYSYSSVAEAIARATPPCESLVVVGHSFGGVIAAMLASGRYGVEPDTVVASSVKVNWTSEELTGFGTQASKPVRWFTDRGEAEDRYRKVSGLTVDVTDDPADLERGVCEEDQRFRLSYDPAAAAVGAPDMAAGARRRRLCRPAQPWGEGPDGDQGRPPGIRRRDR